MDSYLLSPLNFVFLAIFVGALVLGAISDARRLEIPNWISIVLSVAFFPAALVSDLSFSSIAIQYGVAFGIFVIGAALFAFGLIGGGDVKFMSATVLWIHWHQIGPYFFYVAILGGLLAAIILLLLKVQALTFLKDRIPWMSGENDEPQSIPYGLAIAGAGLIMLVQSKFLLFSAFSSTSI